MEETYPNSTTEATTNARGIVRSAMTNRVELVVDSRARVQVRGLPDKAIERLKELHTHSNPEWGQHARFGGRVSKDVPKKLHTWRVEHGEFSVPRASAKQVLEVLRAFGLVVELLDQRNEGEPLWLALVESGASERMLQRLVELRKGIGRRGPLYLHQLSIGDVAMTRENVLVRSPTGSGKTLAELAFIVRADRCALVMVPTLELARQWIREAAAELEATESDFGFIGDGRCDMKPITVGLPQSIASHFEQARIEDDVGTLVVDEVQTTAAATFGSVVDRCSAKYRLGVSADERRKDKLEFLIHEAFGKCAYSIDRDTLIDRGVIVDVEVRMVPTDFDDEDFRRVRDRGREMMARVRDGKRVGPSTARQQKRDEVLAFDALIKRMGSDPERNGLVENICANLGESQALVFAHRREHVQLLHSKIAQRLNTMRIGLMLGSKPDAKRFEEARRGILDGTMKLSIGTYKATGVGINLPAVSKGICATPIHTNRPFYNQVRGRVSRKDAGPNSVIWYLWDHRVFGVAPLEAMLKWNRRVMVRGPDGDWIDARGLGPDAAIEWGRAVALEGGGQ